MFYAWTEENGTKAFNELGEAMRYIKASRKCYIYTKEGKQKKYIYSCV